MSSCEWCFATRANLLSLTTSNEHRSITILNRSLYRQRRTDEIRTARAMLLSQCQISFDDEDDKKAADKK